MTGLDWLVGGILLLSALVGLIRGLTKEVISLAAWILAFWGAKTFAPDLAMLLPGRDAPGLQHAAALVLIFLVILLLAGLIGFLMSKLIDFGGLGVYDRLLGAAFGVARGLVAVVALALAASLTAVPRTQFWLASWCHPQLEKAVLFSKPWLPRDMAAHVQF
jgi:membrane protein required for colicin V production